MTKIVIRLKKQEEFYNFIIENSIIGFYSVPLK